MTTMPAHHHGWVRDSVGRGISTAVSVLLTVAILMAMALFAWNTWGPTIALPDNPIESEKTVVAEPAVLEELADLSRFTAASAQYRVVVEINETHGPLPDWVAGQSATLLATGDVEASVDFSDLGPDHVRIGADGTTATIHLPPAALSDARIDFEASEVVDRDRGAADRLVGIFDDNTLPERELYAEAVADIEEAAARSPLARRAERNTTAMLEDLLAPIGVERVYVMFDGRRADDASFDLRAGYAEGLAGR